MNEVKDTKSVGLREEEDDAEDKRRQMIGCGVIKTELCFRFFVTQTHTHI